MEKKERVKRVVIAIEPTLHRHYQQIAALNKVSFSLLIRQALAEYERTHQPAQPEADRK